MEGVTKGFVIRGRVQGVGFRWWTRQAAETLGVVGTVQN
ncbi:MAG: acylphosphatase, partial [Gemmatimonadetes bacterium]|nr:acylphosphatase [Gemmatimonadota bacterium]